MGFSNFLEDSIFFAENFDSAKEASFNTKTAISAMNLKPHVTTCFYLPQHINCRSTVYSWLMSDARTPVWFSRWHLSGQGVVLKRLWMENLA